MVVARTRETKTKEREKLSIDGKELKIDNPTATSPCPEPDQKRKGACLGMSPCATKDRNGEICGPPRALHGQIQLEEDMDFGAQKLSTGGKNRNFRKVEGWGRKRKKENRSTWK